MKRLFFVAVGLGILVMVSSAVEVTSVNVVGYKKVVIPPGQKFNMVGMNFDAFDATLLGVFGTNQLNQGTATAFKKADKVYIWDTALGDSGGFRVYAQKDDRQFYDVGAWGGSPTNPPLTAGTGMFLQSGFAASETNEIVLMGEAVDVEEQQMDVVEGFQVMAYPFSSDINIQDTDFANDGARKGTATAFKKADKLYEWDLNLGTEGGFNVYGLKDDDQWYDVGAWGGAPVDVDIKVGAGFYYESFNTNGFVWSETNQYLDNLSNP
jgi:hypothetical protein